MATVTVTRNREWWGFYRRILVEMDGERVGGVWNGRDLKIEATPGAHTFRAFMGWIGSKPLEVVVHEASVTSLGVRAPWREAATAKGLYMGPNSVMGPVARGFGHYTSGKPDEGLEISEHPRTVTKRPIRVGILALLAGEVASMAVGPLIAHAAGASAYLVVLLAGAGPVAIMLTALTAYVVASLVTNRRDSRQSR